MLNDIFIMQNLASLSYSICLLNQSLTLFFHPSAIQNSISLPPLFLRCIPASLYTGASLFLAFFAAENQTSQVKLLNRLEVFDSCISFTPTNYCTQSESCRRTVTFPTACDLPSFEQLALASGRLQAWTGQVVVRGHHRV